MALNSLRKVTLMFYLLFCGSVRIKNMIMGNIFILTQNKGQLEQLIKQMEQCFLKEFKTHKNSSEPELKQPAPYVHYAPSTSIVSAYLIYNKKPQSAFLKMVTC